MNKKPQGPRLTKRAREKKREAEKADKALSGGTVAAQDGGEAAKAPPHWYVELQWFRLLRGQARLNQIARILVELAPAKVFDPRDIYAKHKKELAKDAKKELADGMAAEKKKTNKKMSRKEMIIEKNNAKKQKEAAARDAEKLRTLGTGAGTNIKLRTESGKLLLLLSLLKKAVVENNIVDTLDTMWEIEDVAREVDPKEAKAAFKPFADVIKNATEIRNDKSHLGGLNLVDFQLTSMSDRLPPLNLHSLTGVFKLDDWQLHVINLINDQKSVLITAPTSSGKTVLSTYVCTMGARVLFVVPSEPLAWQVAAMLRALKVDIAIVVPTLSFVPLNFSVVVGTPISLESTLTKKVGFDFDYAVFDEIHAVNNDDGPAMQRLIRAIPSDCKILALSATIGNAPELMNWWETIVGEGNIDLVVHKSRFINLQRFIYLGKESMAKHSKEVDGLQKLRDAAASDDDDASNLDSLGTLQVLHPCASLSVEYLTSPEYQSSDVAFTPLDAYTLYKSMDALCGKCSVDISDLKPRKFFAALKEGPVSRITLEHANIFEDALKGTLVQIANQEPDLCRLLLASLVPGVDLKKIKKARKAMLDKPKEELAKFDRETAEKEVASVGHLLECSQDSTSSAALTDLCFRLAKSERTPAICFQLDSVRCQSLFDGILRELEERELAMHPDYRINLERKAKGLKKLKARSDKRKGKQDEEEAEEQQEFGDAPTEAVDIHAPHPDFVLTPPGRAMGSAMTKDIQEKLGGDLPSSGDLAHPLIRGLRRGIGMYIAGLPSAYHRIVQSFAQTGKLGVVFSDELLAYGVNMPFRSCVFFGDPGENWLTPLLHQQMAGRAGRRGLDRQGHLVYAGFSPDRLKALLRGKLPDVTGQFPLYPTIPLQLEMNRKYDVTGARLSPEKMKQMCATPLAQYLKGETVDNYYETAEKWIEHLGVLKHPETSYKELIPELIWELRQFLPESLALEFMLEPLIKKFKDIVYNQQDKNADINQQVSVFLIFCRICSREPYDEETYGSFGGDDETNEALKWVKPLPFPHHKNEEWEEWTEIISKSQQRILDADLDYKETILLPVGMETPLDNMCYASFVRNQIDPSLPTPVQHHLRQRIWNVGEFLRIISNVLGRSAELQSVQNLIRKAFVRIRYILEETSQRNWKKLDEITVSAPAQAPTPPL